MAEKWRDSLLSLSVLAQTLELLSQTPTLGPSRATIPSMDIGCTSDKDEIINRLILDPQVNSGDPKEVTEILCWRMPEASS